MAVADEEVGIKLSQVDGDVPDAVSPVDQRRHSILLTNGSEFLKRHAHTWERDDGVEDSHLGDLSGCFDVDDCFLKGIAKCCIRYGIRILHLTCLGRGRLGDVGNGLLTSTVDGSKVDDGITKREDQVSKNRVYSCSGVGHKDTGVRWGVDYPGSLERNEMGSPRGDYTVCLTKALLLSRAFGYS